MTTENNELPEELEAVIETLFDKFIAEYEMDASGSIEDMLYEFYSEGFINALENTKGDS